MVTSSQESILSGALRLTLSRNPLTFNDKTLKTVMVSFSPPSPETWRSPGFCANILQLGLFEARFQKFG